MRFFSFLHYTHVHTGNIPKVTKGYWLAPDRDLWLGLQMTPPQHCMPPVSHSWPKHTTESPHLSWEPSHLYILSCQTLWGTRQGIMNSYHSFYKRGILTSLHSYHNPMGYLWIIFVKRKLKLLNVIYQVLQLVKERTGTSLAMLLTFIHLNHLFSLSFYLTGRLIRYHLLC